MKSGIMEYLRLLRPKDWAKNLYLFVPMFFASELFNANKLVSVLYGFIAFSFTASSIYILNDYRDREDDRKHPVKCKRPLAAGTVSPASALTLFALLLTAGLSIGWFLGIEFLVVLGLYFVLNLFYSLGLKNISILDLFILASGFVLRIKAGSLVSDVPLSEWIQIMVFLLSLFMAIGKRRDDLLIKLSSGTDMRKSVRSYSLEFLNTMLSVVAAIIIVAYLMYTMAQQTQARLHTYRLYYTGVFVMAGLLRYLQIIYVMSDAGSPTKILYKDRFIQVTLLLWFASYLSILYIKDLHLFK
jgi:decaprenyl-phosphate phosphoribosyltransferase